MSDFAVFDLLARHCRRLFLRDYEVSINIGVHAFEKRGEQRVLVNLELWTPTVATLTVQDQLHEVFDYDTLRDTVQTVVAQGHIHLQETLCDRVAERLMALPKTAAVRISTQKPDIYPDCRAVGVEVLRVRDELLAQWAGVKGAQGAKS